MSMWIAIILASMDRCLQPLVLMSVSSPEVSAAVILVVGAQFSHLSNFWFVKMF